MKLSIEAETASAHLTLLGWKPVRIHYTGSAPIGVQNVQTMQIATVRKNREAGTIRVAFEPMPNYVTIEDIEWWQLTDPSILRLAATIDNSLIGWGE
jgi:hypothetical protein